MYELPADMLAWALSRCSRASRVLLPDFGLRSCLSGGGSVSRAEAVRFRVRNAGQTPARTSSRVALGGVIRTRTSRRRPFPSSRMRSTCWFTVVTGSFSFSARAPGSSQTSGGEPRRTGSSSGLKSVPTCNRRIQGRFPKSAPHLRGCGCKPRGPLLLHALKHRLASHLGWFISH